jgi:hypothetical protein
MNKRLQELLERFASWPPDAQEEAIASLESIEVTVNLNAGLSPAQQEAKLVALREMIHRSIERGGSYTPDDIDAMIDERFGDSRAQGR